MKLILRILLIFVLGFVIFGYATQHYTDNNGKLYIGIGVMLFAFILMPLFVYHRYKNRIEDFIDTRMEKDPNSEINN